ncbi:MAG: phenazine biosynthesis protein PhzF [Spirochaetes bacterium GWB1_36_13]|nr:MAG: phenazine biosynthesis protein PhzF [Spirochaetes bacterium GWB1_36_13]
MKIFNFKKIDAFATINSEGNPAGYIKLDLKEEINEIEMQKLAKELKGYVNEVGFLFQNQKDIFELKYYSSEREVDFCGHATIAIMYDLIKSDINFKNKNNFTIQTNRGILKVENRIIDEDAVFIMSPVPFKKSVSLKAQYIADNLQIKADEIDSTHSISITNAGLTTLLIPIKSLDSILKIHPDFEKLKNFCISNEIDIIEVFTTDVSDKFNDFRVRVFAPTFGYLEDPATGSGNSAFGYYLLSTGQFNKNTIVIEQNGDKNRFNIVKLQKQFDNEGIERIMFGGGAIKRIDGKYFLY